MRILIAEDDFTTRTMLKAVLTRFKYEVTAVADGQTALTTLSDPQAPRLALLDWMMPGLDGAEVCRQLRAVPTDEPPYLVLLTARTDKQDIVSGLDAGANDYIVKPYDIAELQARLAVGARMVDLQAALARRMAELQTALNEVKTLSGIIPICAGCKKIRDDSGFWGQVEAYISSRSLAKFSHGLCPECTDRLYPEVAEEMRRERAAQAKPAPAG